MKRDPLTWAAVLLGCVAFVGSFEHVAKTVADHGQPGWISLVIALMPELTVVLTVLKLRRDGISQPWAWIVGGSAVAFTVAANLSQAQLTVWGVVVAGWPAWSAVGAAGLIEIRPASRATSTDRAVPLGQGAATPSALAEPGANSKVPAPDLESAPAEPKPAAAAGPTPSRQVPSDPGDPLEAVRDIAAELRAAGRAVNYKNVAPGLREAGHTAGRAKVEALIEAVDKPHLIAL